MRDRGQDPELLARIAAIGNRKPTVREVAPLVRDFYDLPGNAVGGSLHIVLDDGNIEDRNVQFCAAFARADNDTLGEALAGLLLRMSHTQRWKLHRTWRYYVAEDGR